jgi:hypothetical protein
MSDCAIAIDATYYLYQFLETSPYFEPLLTALGGLTGIETHLTADLDKFKEHNVIPFFIFDGQPMVCQAEVAVSRAKAANVETDRAWDLYFATRAEDAVTAFGTNNASFRIQSLYPLLMRLLRERDLHFLVPPFNASAQMAYFEMIDSDQVAGIMGSLELLVYPIHDTIIRHINWDAKDITVVSKKQLIRSQNVSESMFIDALLMCGTSFLPPFPPLLDPNITTRQPFVIVDAINILRTADKSVAAACASFSDILQSKDKDWLDKYQRARMAVQHFIYIAESGEVKVNDLEKLTKDNHEYLGLQLPNELYHYLNKGLIGPEILSWITHGQIVVPPTLDGFASDEYKRLVTKQLVPLRQQALALLVPQLHRAFNFKDVTMRVWFDDKYSLKIHHRSAVPQPLQLADSWNGTPDIFTKFPPPAKTTDLITFEILSASNTPFIEMTQAKGKVRGLDDARTLEMVAMLRFFHLRGYIESVDGQHSLTRLGMALAASLLEMKDTEKRLNATKPLAEAILLAFELIRFQLLTTENKHEELHGLPLKGSDADKECLLLISRCATLLKLGHQSNGYTGPLNKNFLHFRSLSSAVREANRCLLESIVTSMFIHGQCKRDRDDFLKINQEYVLLSGSHARFPANDLSRLPFLSDLDVGLGIAVRTFFDEDSPTFSKEERAQRLSEFPSVYMPYTTGLVKDMRLCWGFVDALCSGVSYLADEIPEAHRDAWAAVARYIKDRPF